jgi:hypothetical protein
VLGGELPPAGHVPRHPPKAGMRRLRMRGRSASSVRPPPRRDREVSRALPPHVAVARLRRGRTPIRPGRNRPIGCSEVDREDSAMPVRVQAGIAAKAWSDHYGDPRPLGGRRAAPVRQSVLSGGGRGRAGAVEVGDGCTGIWSSSGARWLPHRPALAAAWAHANNTPFQWGKQMATVIPGLGPAIVPSG